MSTHVFWNLECAVKEGQLDNLKALMAEMVDATQANEPGAWNYEWSISEDRQKLHLFERYADSDAVVLHMSNFGTHFAGRFLAMSDIKRFTVYGRPNEQARKVLGKAGAQFMSPLGGFSR